MFKIECISGPQDLQGQIWTFEEGMKYRMGRSPDADIVIPRDMTVSSDNTVFAVKNGIPYVGSHKVDDDETIGTWLNGSYLTERAEDISFEIGWYPLNNDDIISIGREGRSFKFRVISDYPLSMVEIRKNLKREIVNPKRRRPLDIFKRAKGVNRERIKKQVEKTMEEVYRDINLTIAVPEKDLSAIAGEINTKRVIFKETDIPDESSVLNQILEDVRIQNNVIDEQEEILNSHVRTKEFVSGTSERIADREQPAPEMSRPVFSAAAAAKKDYKTDFHFDTLQKIGKGGFSNVFLIRDRRDDELLVLKSLDVVKEMTRLQEAKYLREADLGEKLDHKNLVKTYDIRRHNGNYYMIMEYCDGGSIADLMKESYGYLDLEEATEYFLQVLDGLDYLHNAELEQPDQNGVMHKITGIVHRDIKPENMLIKNVNGEKVVKISDFGLSKSYELAGYSGITNGEAAGSRKYCSKRQFSDNYKYVGPQDDVFSAAASYYEMITGKCVRDREKFKDINLAILSGSLVPVRAANPHIPQALADVIDSVLQEERLGSDSRFTTAKELKEKIKSALNIR